MSKLTMIMCCPQDLPNFGTYREEKQKTIAELKQKADLLDGKARPVLLRNLIGPEKPIPSVKDIIGRAVSMIGAYGDLDNKQQMVALIDEV